MGQMLDMSLLTPSKIPVVEQKRRKLLMEEPECLEEILVTIDLELQMEMQKVILPSTPSKANSKKRQNNS